MSRADISKPTPLTEEEMKMTVGELLDRMFNDGKTHRKIQLEIQFPDDQ